MNLGNPSKQISAYIKLVQERTGRNVVIRPYDDATPSDFPRASLEIGPGVDDVDIRFSPVRHLDDPNTEKQIAHELTHALMVYAEGYQLPCAPAEVSQYDVQTVAEIVLIDEIGFSRFDNARLSARAIVFFPFWLCRLFKYIETGCSLISFWICVFMLWLLMSFLHKWHYFIFKVNGIPHCQQVHVGDEI